MDDLVDRLQSLYVWPQSVADHHADVLTPRQIEKLYEVGNVAEQAIARIQALETSLAEVEGRVIAEVVAWLRDPHTTMKHMDLWITRTKAGKITSRAMGDIGTAGWFAREAATALETGEWKK